MTPPRTQDYGQSVLLPDTSGSDGKKLYVFGEVHPMQIYHQAMRGVARATRRFTSTYTQENRAAITAAFVRIEEHLVANLQNAVQSNNAVVDYVQALDNAFGKWLSIGRPHFTTETNALLEACRITMKSVVHQTYAYEQKILDQLNPERLYWEGTDSVQDPVMTCAKAKGVPVTFVDSDASWILCLANETNPLTYNTFQTEREMDWMTNIHYGGNIELLVCGLDHANGVWGLHKKLKEEGIPSQPIGTEFSELLWQDIKRKFETLNMVFPL